MRFMRNFLILSVSFSFLSLDVALATQDLLQMDDCADVKKEHMSRRVKLQRSSSAPTLGAIDQPLYLTEKSYCLVAPPLYNFREFVERCPGHLYVQSNLGNGLYLEGINTEAQYMALHQKDFGKILDNNARLHVGEG